MSTRSLTILDLIVAVGLGVLTSPSPLQIFRTTPPSTRVTQFPLALVPTFLVPLAFTLHARCGSCWVPMGVPPPHRLVPRADAPMNGVR